MMLFFAWPALTDSHKENLLPELSQKTKTTKQKDADDRPMTVFVTADMHWVEALALSIGGVFWWLLLFGCVRADRRPTQETRTHPNKHSLNNNTKNK